MHARAEPQDRHADGSSPSRNRKVFPETEETEEGDRDRRDKKRRENISKQKRQETEVARTVRTHICTLDKTKCESKITQCGKYGTVQYAALIREPDINSSSSQIAALVHDQISHTSSILWCIVFNSVFGCVTCFAWKKSKTCHM